MISTPTALVAAAAALGLVLTTSAGSAAAPARSASHDVRVQTVSCSTTVGNDVWRGEARITVAKHGLGYRATLQQYRLTTPQNGRTGANVEFDLGVDGWDGDTAWTGAESGDGMVQDGQWHEPRWTVETQNLGHAGAQQRMNLRGEFVFDRKTWADPSCTTSTQSESVPDAPQRHLPTAATQRERDLQPALDFDTDSCYPVPAIRSNGTTAPGIGVGDFDVTGGCRDAADLVDSNTYVRSKSSNGWTAHMYAYYFEKDHTGVPLTGHRHDLEHVVVWAKDGERTPRYVATSAHGKYEIRDRSDVLWAGDRAQVVYHKDGVATHAFRFGTAADAAFVENDLHAWHVGGLVGWDGFPAGYRDRLTKTDFGSAKLDLRDDRFSAALASAKPAGIPFVP